MATVPPTLSVIPAPSELSDMDSVHPYGGAGPFIVGADDPDEHLSGCALYAGTASQY
jgi:hypothetical protein